MNPTGLILLFFVILVFMTPFIRKSLKNRKQYWFAHLLNTKSYEEMEKGLNAFSSKALFPRYELECYRLQMYLVQNNLKKVDEQYQVTIESAVTKKQKIEIYTNAFEHYVMLADKSKSLELKNKLKEFNDESLNARCQMLYDIFVNKKSKYIDQLEKNFDKLQDSEKMLSAYLLSVQYTNKGDTKKADYYSNLSKDFFE